MVSPPYPCRQGFITRIPMPGLPPDAPPAEAAACLQRIEKAPAVAVLEAEESGFVRVRRRSWARLIQKVWLDDPELCPKCGERMKARRDTIPAMSWIPRAQRRKEWPRNS